MRPVAGCPAPWLVLFLVAGFLAGARDHDPIGLDRDRHRAVAGPVLGVHRIVLDRGVQPQAVALLAVVERPLELAAAAAGTAPATASAATPPLGLVAGDLDVVVVLVLLVLVLLGLGIERRRDQRVVLGAQVEIVAVRDGALGFPALRCVELVIALELAQILDRDLELMGDPGVGPALSYPRPDLIQLWTQGSGCHRRANLADVCKKTFVSPVPGTRETTARRQGGIHECWSSPEKATRAS